MAKRENSAEEPTLTKTYINILYMFWSFLRQINSKLKRKKVANTYNRTSPLYSVAYYRAFYCAVLVNCNYCNYKYLAMKYRDMQRYVTVMVK